jgi:hypothetical protein
VPGKRAEGLVRVEFWADGKLRSDAMDKAASEDTTLSEVLREFLREYAGVTTPPN